MTPSGNNDGGGDTRAVAPKQKAVATPWGPASLLTEVRLPQRAGERRFASIVQLLQLPKGGRLVRFAYTTDGTARRGPVTLRERDVARLRELLEEQPELRELLDV